MKRILLVSLLLPKLAFAQLTYQDFKYLADTTPQKSVELIKSKGYRFENTYDLNELITNLIFYKYNKPDNSINSSVSIAFAENSKNVIIYQEYKRNIQKTVEETAKKLGYKFIKQSYGDDGICDLYESTNYRLRTCESYDEEYNKTNFMILFHRIDFAENNDKGE
ncbi:hypothetical protein [Empedobacter brevis]|uniref:hypothetical protein n=1 Tax=Empedobacter brevis TaxID=247 RepID=UPI0028D1518F|nr:hypothetical protein [Empedobacter brevis]